MRWTKIPAALAAALLAAACGDSLSPKPDAIGITGRSTSAECTASLSSLLSQAETVFGSGSPNLNSVVGKLNNLNLHLSNNNTAAAKDRAFDIVHFTLDKEHERDLAGTDAQIASFVNSVYCFAGIDITVSDPENTFLIYPSDTAQIVIGLNGNVGISFPGLPVNAPAQVTIEKFEGRLNTKLDQFPGFVYIRLEGATDIVLTSPATVRVCATDVPSAEVLAGLRLGHGINDNAGFEITPLPTANDPVNPTLSCDQPAPVQTALGRLIDGVTRFFSPKTATAQGNFSLGGGVSGTVNEFSPFAPVDAQLSFGGGVSGTVNEFIRVEPLAGAANLETSQDCSNLVVGAEVPSECLPQVTVKTRTFGTRLENVPVQWAVAALSGGTIAPRSVNGTYFVCGDFARSASTLTSANGNASVCWRVGAAGAYSVAATVSQGGDAPPGVRFSTNTVNFSLTVTPVTLSIVAGNNQTAPAGTTLPIPPTVRVLDANGQPAAGVWVDFTALANADARISENAVRTNASGEAWVNWTIGAGYNELRAMVRNAGDETAVYFTATGTSGTVVMNSCPVGGSRDPINDPSRPFGFYVPGPELGTTMREVDLYFGATGKANRADVYNIALITRRGGGFLGPVVDTTVVPVELRGTSSENKRATFRLRNPVVGRTGSTTATNNIVAMRLVVLGQTDNATINFNTGPCPLGGTCKVPRGCAATEVNMLTVTTTKLLGDVYRRSVGLEIRGN